MAIFTYSLVLLSTFNFSVGLDAFTVDSVREQVLSEVKAYFDRELDSMKKQYDTKIDALGAELMKSKKSIANLRSQNELLQREMRKVLFTFDNRCRNAGQSFEDFGRRKSDGVKKLSVPQTASHELLSYMNQDWVRTEDTKRRKKSTGIPRNPSVNVGKVSTPRKAVSLPGKKRQVNTPMPPGFGVAFFALLNNHSLNTNANQNIVFDKTITNIGGAFHTSSSLFVATIPGVYVFSILAQGQHAHVKLVKNGQLVARVDLDDWGQSSQLIVLQLKKGDDVALRNDDISGINYHGDLFSSFAGFLLYDYSDGAPIVGK